MRNLLSIVLILIASAASAQNFSPITPGTIRYFLNAEGYLRGMRIDSIAPSGSDMFYYPYRSLRGNYTTQTQIMLDSNGGSWLGKKIIKQADGSWLFDNIFSDTVVIKTQAHTGDSWIFYDDSTDLYYRGELIQEGQAIILGTIDSFKKIKITAHNSLGQVTTDPVNNTQIELSKNNGFVRIFDLHTFPYHRPNQVYQTGFDYFLDFSSNQNMPGNMIYSLIDFHYPTQREMFDWEVGDEMQYITKDGVYQNSFPDYVLDKITGKVVNSNSTDYTILRKTDKSGTTWPYHYSATYSTHTYNFTDNSFFNTRMPEEYLQNYGIYYDSANQDNCVNTPFYSLRSYMISGNMYFFGFFYVPFQNTYKWGLGRIDYYLVDGEPKVYEKELVYYRRGNTTCGTLYNLNVGKLGSKEDITIYPNPASDFFTITYTKNITGELSLVDLLGKELLRLPFNNKISVDILNIGDGVYFIHLRLNDGQSYTSKILIHH